MRQQSGAPDAVVLLWASNVWLALAVDDGGLGAAFAALAGGCDGGLHLGDEGFGLGLGVDYSADEANVFVDVGQGMGGQG